MQKQELIKCFIGNHQKVVQYINGLTDAEFTYAKEGKWTAGQQLEHILLTVSPFPNILNSKELIIKKFGIIDRPMWNYKTVLDKYFKTTLKAPEPFLPQREVTADLKVEIINEISNNLKEIKEAFLKYSEKELDSLSLPHPLLGKLTIREMFYLMSYHPLHHQNQIMKVLSY